MFFTTTLAWVVLAVAAINADAAKLTGRSIGEFTEGVQKAARELCERRAGLSLGSMDPLAVGTFTTRAGSFVVNNKNAVLTGLSRAVLSNPKWLENNRGSVQVSANLTMTSDYAASGKFLFLPMSTSGKMTVDLYNLKADVSFTFRKVLINSIEYMEVDDLKSVYTIGLMQFNMKSDGNCSPADTLANAALNANWRLFESAATTEISPIIDEKVEAELNAVFSKIPFYELFSYSQL